MLAYGNFLIRKSLTGRLRKPVFGMRFFCITYGSRIELVPIQPMKSLKGIFKGINTEIEREKDRI